MSLPCRSLHTKYRSGYTTCSKSTTVKQQRLSWVPVRARRYEYPHPPLLALAWTPTHQLTPTLATHTHTHTHTQAGLESITVAHLAVSSQCLGFLADFAPKFRARLEAVLPPNGTVFLKHLDRFSRDATNHRNEFYSKMVLMVKEGPSYAKAWKPANWMSEGTQGISSLLKELARILKKGGLEKILDKAQLRFVVYPVLYMYFLKIKSCISEMRNLDTDASLLAKVQQDLLHYKVNVENLGFSVLRSAVSDPSWLPDDDEMLPEGDDEVLALFLPEGSSSKQG